MIRIFKALNGWLSFALGTVLFFVAPHLYRYLDPTAGAYDAGYIMPIIYAMIVVSFASGFAWALVRFTAPGPYKDFDKFLEGEHTAPSDTVKVMLALYFFFMAMVVIIIACMV
jgi:hypothetical protein